LNIFTKIENIFIVYIPCLVGLKERVDLNAGAHVKIGAYQVGQSEPAYFVELRKGEGARPHSRRILIVKAIAPLQIAKLSGD
jgi:hypothetical protein